MLLFEFFPAFVMVVSLIVGVWLYLADRDAPDDSTDRERRRREVTTRAARDAGKGGSADRGGRRPSMSA